MELRKRNKKNICEELFLSEASLMPAPLRLNFNHSVLESFVQILMLMKKTCKSIKVISTYDTAGSRHLKAKIIASYYSCLTLKRLVMLISYTLVPGPNYTLVKQSTLTVLKIYSDNMNDLFIRCY